MAEVHRGESAFEDTPYTIIGRLCARTASGSTSPIEREGKLVQQSDISSITVKAYNELGEIIQSYTPTVADVIYDTIQTTSVFAGLARGGNFLYQVPATAFPTGSTNVRIEITVTLSSGELVRSVWAIPVINLYQS